MRCRVSLPTPASRFSIFLLGCLSALLALNLNPANGAVLNSSTTNTSLINPGGGSDSGWIDCGVDSVIVGFRWSGGNSASSPYSFYCRSLNANGTIPSDQSTVSNTTQKTLFYSNSGSNVEWCAPGTVAIGVRHSGWSSFALVCKSPPELTDTANVSRTISSPTDRLCASTSVMIGMGRWTGAWLDSLYGVCRNFAYFSLTYKANSGTGTVPATQTQSSIGGSLTVATWSGTRTGFIFSGWNTAANGSGTTYAINQSVTPTSNLTLYARWLTACSPTTSYGGGNQVMTFAAGSSCAYVVPAGVTSIDLLVVGGGRSSGESISR